MAYYDDDELQAFMEDEFCKGPALVTISAPSQPMGYDGVVFDPEAMVWVAGGSTDGLTYSRVKSRSLAQHGEDSCAASLQALAACQAAFVAYAGARDSDCDGIAASLSEPKPATHAPVSRVRPAISGLDVVAGGDHRPGAWKAVR